MSGRASSKSAACRIESPGDPSLPVAGRGSLAGVRRSKNSKLRAAVLIGVHVVILAHITHFVVKGETLSPVEPSESMYTLELGEVNAGFIFFALALLSTLIVGRFFCGWGCHLVALQDLCGWIMKKAGIRPRPLRARLLVWIPLVVAVYMFVWPTVRRWTIEPRPHPGFSNHLMTDGFWDTFPGPFYAVATFLVCGFAAVYFLGAKGFCTYGCPYGGLFGVLDQVGVGRIKVNDACEQCGHCTATCTSNVRVHEEVRLYGQVVDPGCMKCLDCVSVCPKNALSFGFGKPALFKDKSKTPRRHFDFTLAEESVFLAVGFGTFLAFRGLYDGPPLLMSVGLGGIGGFVAMKLWKMFRRPTVRVQNLVLRLGGELQPAGKMFAAGAALWFAFTLHSGWIQWNRHAGARWLERTEISRAELLSGEWRHNSHSPEHERAVEKAMSHFGRVDRYGLVDWVEAELGLAWLHMTRDEPAAAERHIRRAVELTPGVPNRYQSLAEFLSWQGRHGEAAEALEKKIEVSRHPDPRDWFRLGAMRISAERFHDAVAAYRECIALSPEAADAHHNLGALLRRMGRYDEAAASLATAAELDPGDAATHVEWGLALAEAGRGDEALPVLRRAVELDPDGDDARRLLPDVIRRLESSQ